MNLIPPRPFKDGIIYPESDGLPLSDNSKQFRWIFVLYGNLAALFRHGYPRRDVCRLAAPPEAARLATPRGDAPPATPARNRCRGAP